ncbi:hypothetical protein ABEB36_000710 [Hypothenemus hampei]
MNDEAATHYHSIIDQMTWGLRKLNDTFGECGRPKIGWQIDPFGHSREMANIFAELGFDAVLLGRIDYQEKEYRWKTQTPEMVWRGSDSLGKSSDIFTGILYNTYGPPPGFCFDILCNDDPFIDDKKSFEYNVDQKVDDFIAYLDNATKVYTTNNILITMGEDFTYQDAESWFINLDKLITYVNQRQENGSKYHLIYSTPSCYVQSVYNETVNNTKWLLKEDDFFPYASDPHAFWTGYFTSRPAIKRFERIGNNFLQVCKQLYALADLGPEDSVDLNALREAMGVMQHHDAITGTEKQHVANDYARHLQQGIEECEIITQAAIIKLSNQTDNIKINENTTFNSCQLLNISQCSYSENYKKFAVTIYNPLSRSVDKLVRVPVLGNSYSVIDSKNNSLETQIISIPDFVKNIPGRNSKAEQELVFIANDLPAFGWKSYIISETSNGSRKAPIVQKQSDTVNIKDASLIVDVDTGLLKNIIIGEISLPVNQTFQYYEGFVGDNSKFEKRSSGAYIFRPDGPIVNAAETVNYTIVQGNLVSEIRQQFNEFISQIIRVNSIDNFVEFDWVIGPLPQNGTKGIEVVTKFTSNLKSDSTFYTDTNGKGELKRVRDFRPTWNLNLSEPIAGNYYPITSQISIREDDFELAVLVDRAQGGSSLKDGEIELMIHRVCLHDDAFGVGEALNETAFDKGLVVRGSHYVTIGNRSTTSDSVSATTRDIAQRKLLDAWIFFTPLPSDDTQFNFEFSGLTRTLPRNVQILTLEPWIGFSFLLRLEHVFEINEDPTLAQPVVVQLEDLFVNYKILSAQETTLGGNQWLKDNHRLNFEANDIVGHQGHYYYSGNLLSDFEENFNDLEMQRQQFKRQTTVVNADNDLNITLTSGQIRTFIITINNEP